MKRQLLYEYLGTNGTLLTPIHLEDIYYIRKIKLTADEDKILTNGEYKTKYTIIPEEDLPLWSEIEIEGQN